MNIKGILITLCAICLCANTVYAGTFNANAKTKRVPAGTLFQIEFLQPVSTYSGMQGDSFVATLKNEQSSGTNIILPMGTVVRGSIQDVKTAKRFSRGAKLYLDFDHVVTPTGRQIPLDMSVVSYENIYYDGGLYKNLGYKEAVQENYEKGVQITKNATNYGLKAGESAPGIQYLTTPFCAVGGFIGGVGYFVGDTVADMFRKGKEVYINQGDVLTVKLLNPIDIPVY
ncbi:MAG: hypothetical protein MJ231_06570 [bacterium]|nr:hypothetical protein [bacterium]